MKARRRTGLRKKFLDGKLTMNEDSVKKKAKLAVEAHDYVEDFKSMDGRKGSVSGVRQGQCRGASRQRRKPRVRDFRTRPAFSA